MPPDACAITSLAWEAMIAHARRELPRECCGVLVGHRDSILEAAPVPNVAELPSRFMLDPAGHIAARREARGRGLLVLGFYHSHPSAPPVPSAIDLAEATYPDSLYAIVSLAGEEPLIRLFEWRDERFAERKILIHG